VLIALLTTRAHTAEFEDLEGQKRLDGVRNAFYDLESKLLDDEERRKMFEVLLGTARDKNSSSTVVEHMTQAQYSEVRTRAARGGESRGWQREAGAEAVTGRG